MNVFKRNRLNLTWIESFPIARPEGGYLFFVELEGHESDPRCARDRGAVAQGGPLGNSGVLRQDGPRRVD